MKTALRISALALALLLTASLAGAQSTSQFGNIAERQRTSTVLGGTGLFNTFSTRTLYKGEFNFALFWNNFDRSPGALDINQVPFNITVGLTDRWELWVDWVAWQQTTSRQPFLLSGYQYNAVRQFGSPYDILGPPVGGRNGAAAFFPGTGALVGGILPALGRYGIPPGGDGLNNLPSPAGQGRSPVAGLGPAFVASQPNYFNDLPMFGVVDFLGFDSLGRPLLGPRQSANGTGDIYAGSKFNLIDPNRGWFSLALGGYVKFPISRSDNARARGRTSGEFKFAPTLILGQEFIDHRLRFYENVGYVHTTDIHQRGVKVLDLRDHLQLNVGGAMAINKYIELVGEVAGNVYVGGGTPSLQQSDPWDLNLGARFYFRDGSIAFGGAYRRQLNALGSRAFDALECMEVPQEPPPDDCHGDWSTHGGDHHPCPPPPPPPPPKIECKQKQVRVNGGDRNGFVGFFSVGTRKGCPPPPVPVCVIESSSRTLTRGDRLTLTVKPSIPGYSDSQIAYDYRWEIRDARGNSVSVTGNGPNVEVPTDRLDCGNYTALVTVIATAKGVEHPDCPDRTAQSNCSLAFEITEAPCPNITCNIIASETSVVEGARVTLRATAIGDSNFSYVWTTTGGRLSSTTGREVTLDTTGIIGPITATVRLMPDRTRCGEPCPGSSCSMTITTREVPRRERPRILVPCGPIFFPFNSARINNEHKACLDEVAIEMQQDPRSTVVIDGHRDSSERIGISLTRANNARDYLVTEKGIDAARIRIRNFGDTCQFPNGDRKLNGRVEFWILPEGAVVEDIGALKKCATGASPRVITTEQPAPATTPPRRTPRRRNGRPEPLADADAGDGDDETEDAPTGAIVQTTAPPQTSPSSLTPRGETTLGKATIVQAVSAQAVNGGVCITIKTDGAAVYQDFTLSDPARIVVDITGVRWAGISQALGQSIGPVERLRIGEPQSGMVRIVLDMKSPVAYHISRNGALIILTIGEQAIALTRGSD
jgi:flagellar motor protein MotB